MRGRVIADGYETCPRCRGNGEIGAYTEVGDGISPSVLEYFPCPHCFGAGSVEKSEIMEAA